MSKEKPVRKRRDLGVCVKEIRRERSPGEGMEGLAEAARRVLREEEKLRNFKPKPGSKPN